MTPRQLMSVLSVPGTNDPIRLFVTETANGEPYKGWVEDLNGVPVGRLVDFRFTFVDFAYPTVAERVQSEGPREASAVPHFEFITPSDHRIDYVGNWFDIGEYLKGTHGDDSRCAMILKTNAPRIELQLHAHPWSGICQIEINGHDNSQIDLFNPSTAIPRFVNVANPDEGMMIVAVRPTGEKNGRSMGRQVLIEGVREYDGQLIRPAYAKPPVRNRGGAFTPRFFQILDSLPEDAVVLDVGGGKRQLDDSRYINLEYAFYEEPDIFGDACRLPFKSESVDFLYTAAVLEHLKDPLRAGREIYRVLKPGGQVLANSAFMQPVHSEGQHFFNVTPYGMEEIFSNFGTRQVFWEGNLGFTLDWFLKVTEISRKADPEDLRTFTRIVESFDKHLSYDKLMYVASGVWLEGTK